MKSRNPPTGCGMTLTASTETERFGVTWWLPFICSAMAFRRPLVKVLGYRQARDQHIDVIHFGQQEACVKKCLVGRAGWVVGVQRSAPHFCPVRGYAGNEGLPIDLHMQKIILGFPVKSRTEPISGRRTGRAKQGFRASRLSSVGEL
jgi:hypothetical protein